MTAETFQAADTFMDELGFLNAMEAKRLSPELDQDVRDLVRFIGDHGPDYKLTKHGDMTIPLLRSLNRLVQLVTPNA